MIGIGQENRILEEAEWKEAIDRWIREEEPGPRVLIVPPDITRLYSYAGKITAYLYHRLKDGHKVSIMPAVGTHMQMTKEERQQFFGDIPDSAFITHDWRTDNVCVGTIPEEFAVKATGGRFGESMDVLVDRRLVSGEFDTIISVGQVVPHEVVGMANYTKNLVVGLGGRDMINKSHMISAICNIETIMGNVDSPVRAVFDYAQKNYLDRLAVAFFLTVTEERDGSAGLYGLFMGKSRDTFEEAALLAGKKNITYLKKRADKVVAYLEPGEFRSTWVGNKAIYRTRMAIADGGELLIIAPGIRQFGENPEVDACIRKYGYCGTERILRLYRDKAFEGLEMVAAHLIHGSSDGRFQITYATDEKLMDRETVEKAGFSWMDVNEALKLYRPEEKETGEYEENGEAYYFVKAPAVGLWRVR